MGGLKRNRKTTSIRYHWLSLENANKPLSYERWTVLFRSQNRKTGAGVRRAAFTYIKNDSFQSGKKGKSHKMGICQSSSFDNKKKTATKQKIAKSQNYLRMLDIPDINRTMKYESCD